jgi:hypothetical protein
VLALGGAVTGNRAGGGALLVGSPAMALLGLVPILGPLSQFVVTAASFGAVVVGLRRRP